MLTRSGLGAAVAAIVLGVFGWWWQYEELVVVAACVVAALLIAAVGAHMGGRLEIERRIPNPRVARGDSIQLVYRAQNRSRRSTVAGEITDHCDGIEARVAVPALSRLSRLDVPSTLATGRRGIFPVGPSIFERLDPFGLAVGQRTFSSSGSVIVHPRVVPISAPRGDHQSVDSDAAMRRAASDPLSGFVSLRQYVDGDDPRLIHWPTTARMGTMMVREHVEIRRPSFTIMIDTDRDAATADDFEEMVDVGASIAVHALQHGIEVRVQSTDPHHPGSPEPLNDVTQVLDLLTPIQQSAADHTLDGRGAMIGLTYATRMFVITGPAGPVAAHPVIASDVTSIIRIGVGATNAGVSFAASNANEFAHRWQA
ncbi:MAG TPA: DUF58 domain-containing protein [Ilumatobacter sp.]|nr:DUF58 domain-containing protein [Ilumatobacter sp.]